jgi:uncharacterized membrane protein
MSFSVYQHRLPLRLQNLRDRPCSTVNFGAAFAVYQNHETAAQEMRPPHGGEKKMLFTLALILFVAWLLGLVGVYTIGSIVHVLLVIALVLFLIGIISGRRTVV